MDIPLALVSVHAEDNGGIGWRVVERGLQEQKIRTKLAYRERSSIDKKAHPYVGGVADMTGRDQDG